MSILADWFRRAMGKDRATLIGRDNAACREWQHAYPDAGFGESIMQAKFDAANERIALATAAYQAGLAVRGSILVPAYPDGSPIPPDRMWQDYLSKPAETPYAQACHARTKGWPQWKINFDLTAHERSIRTARGNRTRYARLRASK